MDIVLYVICKSTENILFWDYVLFLGTFYYYFYIKICILFVIYLFILGILYIIILLYFNLKATKYNIYLWILYYKIIQYP